MACGSSSPSDAPADPAGDGGVAAGDSAMGGAGAGTAPAGGSAGTAPAGGTAGTAPAGGTGGSASAGGTAGTTPAGGAGGDAIVWSRRLGEKMTARHGPLAIEATRNGEVYVGGRGYLIKLSASGAQTWTWMVPPELGPLVDVAGIALHEDGDLRVAATVNQGTGVPGAERAAFIRVATAGTTRGWEVLQSSATTRATGLVCDERGDCYLAGVTTGALPGQTHRGGEDAFVAMFPAGRIRAPQWLQQWGSPEDDRSRAVTSIPPWIAVVGDTGPPGVEAQMRAWVTALDASGSVQRTVDVRGAEFDGFRASAATSDHPSSRGVYVTGYAFRHRNAADGQQRDAYLALVDPTLNSGQVRWLHTFGTGSDDRGEGVTRDARGPVVVGSTQGSLTGAAGGLLNAFAVRVSPSGQVTTLGQWGGGMTARTQATAVTRGTGTTLYLGGTTDGNLFGNPIGETDLWVLALTP